MRQTDTRTVQVIWLTRDPAQMSAHRLFQVHSNKIIEDIRLLEKAGGKSGHWIADDDK